MRAHAAIPPAALALLAACSTREPAGAPLRDIAFDARTHLEAPIVLPLLDAPLPVIEVEVVGAGRARFIVDSGMEISLLDAGFARRHGLVERPLDFELHYSSAAGKLVRVERAADVAQIRIGAASAFDLHMPLREIDNIGPQYDGFLGQDILGDWGLLFLPARRELVLLPGSAVIASLSGYVPQGTPLEALSSSGAGRILRLPFDVNEGALHTELIVDTGSDATTLPEAALELLGATAGAPIVSQTLSGASERKTRLVHGFPLGSQRISLWLENSTTDHGLLGWDALSQRVFVLDGPGRRVLIEASAVAPPGSAPATPAESAR